MLLVGLAASDAALPAPAPLNARWRGALGIPEGRQLAPIWPGFLPDAVQLMVFGG